MPSPYSQTHFTLRLLSGCVLLLIAVGVSAAMLRHAYLDALADVQQTLHAVMTQQLHLPISRTRHELRLLASLTTQKLSVLHFKPDTIATWLHQTFGNYRTSRQGDVPTLAIYDDAGRRAFVSPADPPSPCLPDDRADDDFCLHDATLAFRVTIPTYDLLYRERGALAAVVIFPADMLRATERRVGVHLLIVGEGKTYFPALSGDARVLAASRVTWIRWQPYLHATLDLPFGQTAHTLVGLRSAWPLVLRGAEHALALVIGGSVYFFLVISSHQKYRRISFTYRAIFDNITDWICYRGLRGEYYYINRGMAFQLFGLHPRLVVSLPVSSLPMSATRQQLDWAFHEALSANAPSLQEILIQDGRTLSILTAPIFDERERLTGIVTCVRDLTQLAQMRHDADAWKSSALSAQGILRVLFEALPEWVCVMDNDGQVLTAGAQMTTDWRGDFAAHQEELRQCLAAMTDQFMWTLTLRDVARAFLTTRVQIQADPPRWLLFARDMTGMASDHQLLRTTFALLTQHVKALTTQKRRSEIVALST